MKITKKHVLTGIQWPKENRNRFVVWRECFEAIVIIGILYAFLKKTDTRGLKAMWAGVVSGVLLSLGTACAILFAQDALEGRAQVYFETTILLVSAVLMTQMFFWMRKRGRQMKSMLETDLREAMNRTKFWGVFAVAALSVAREGAEAAIYVYGLCLEKSASPLVMSLSVAAGLALALSMAWAISRGINILKSQLFFKVTGAVLLISAAGLATTGIGKLVSENVVPALIDPVWDISRWISNDGLTASLLRSLTGYNPRPSLTEILFYSGYWGLVVLFIYASQLRLKRVAAVVACFVILQVIAIKPAQAIEYYELEVYGYQTAAEHELEIENTTSTSSDEDEKLDTQIWRSSFEFNYGISDRWEATVYLDYTKPADDNAEYTAFRAHGRTRFFEKGEYPVDLGAYFEIELPRNFGQKDVGFEFRPILEKDFSRFTLSVNPIVELSHATGDSDETSGEADADEAPGSTPQALHWMTEWGLATSLAMNVSEFFHPHLDWHVGFTDNSSLVMPAADFKLGKALKLTTGLGFGLNPATERRILLARLEYELYF